MARGALTAMAPTFDAREVRRYYDRHTRSFIKFGQGGQAGAIHRAVWGPGVTTRAEAFHYVEDRIAALAQTLDTSTRLHAVDLGCGIGASVCYLAQRLPMRGTGVTLSPVQAHLAARRIAEAGLSARVACIEADYCDLPQGLGPADLAYAIESFVHGPSPARFFAECQALLRPGGLLVLCDDVRRPTRDPRAARTIERFTRGWHVNALLSREELLAVGRGAGFLHESTADLTSYLELGRPRDRAIDALAAVLGPLPVHRTRLGPMIGGSALQACLARGWIGYDLMVFRRI